VHLDTGLHITGSDGTYVADLVFFENYSRKNGGIKMLLVVIDAVSRYIYVVPMKKKSDTLAALKSIKFSPAVKILYTDSGSEFTNKAVKDWAEKEGIELRPGKANNTVYLVERVNRTLRDLIERYITTHNFRYIDALDDIVANYNHSPHRALKIGGKLKSPAEVTDRDRIILRLRAIEHNPGIIEELKSKYRVGAKVRLKVKKSVFAKGGTGRFSEQLYTIKQYWAPARVRIVAARALAKLCQYEMC
jgi:hypothetical protein